MEVSINKIILGLFYIMPFIESINGIFLGHHVSDAYRVLMLIFILIYLFFTHKHIYRQTFEMFELTLFFLMLTFLQYTVLHGGLAPLRSDLKTISRILLAPLYYAYFFKACRERDVSKKDLKKLLMSYAISYVVLIVIPSFFNLGLATYDAKGSGFLPASEGIGSKGYFVEINSLVAILIACMFFTGETALKQLKNKQIKQGIGTFMITLGLAYSQILTSTKTGMMASILYLIVVIVRILFGKTLDSKLKSTILKGILIISVISIPLLYRTFEEQINSFVERSKYFYTLFNGNLLTFITSSRSTYLIETIKLVCKSGHTIFLHLFGGGYYSDFSEPYFMYKRTTTEMDWWDMYFSYGITGFLVYLSYFRTSIANFIFKKKTPVSLMLTAFIIYSVIAGHVIFNSMTATFLAIIMALFMENSREIDEKEN